MMSHPPGKYFGATTSIPILKLSGEPGNSLQAVAALKQQLIDPLFLNIQMPQISCINLDETFKHRSKIVFKTAFDQYVVQVFELDVTGYLVKPSGLNALRKQ